MTEINGITVDPMWDLIEPAVKESHGRYRSQFVNAQPFDTPDQSHYDISIAISLKRIADALEPVNVKAEQRDLTVTFNPTTGEKPA